jgi:hypothetical protein
VPSWGRYRRQIMVVTDRNRSHGRSFLSGRLSKISRVVIRLPAKDLVITYLKPEFTSRNIHAEFSRLDIQCLLLSHRYIWIWHYRLFVYKAWIFPVVFPLHCDLFSQCWGISTGNIHAYYTKSYSKMYQ